MTPSADIQRLIEIMAALRTPGTGCPWDLEQTFATIAPYTIEEAYEVADAIARDDLTDLKDELGDLLLQVVYHAQLAEERGAFAFGDVVQAITAKLIRRHPHVFGDATAKNAGDVKGLWEKIKEEERAEKDVARVRLQIDAAKGAAQHSPSPVTGEGRGGGGAQSARTGDTPLPIPPPQGGREFPTLLAGVPVALPALTRAIKLQDKAAEVGFDWPDLAPVFDKLKEELREFEEVARPHDPRSPSPHSSWGEGRGEGRQQATAQAAAPHPNPLPAEGRGEGMERAIKEEFGDLLFVMANIARHLKIDPEAALRGANQKFMRRFAHIETRLAERGSTPAQSTLPEMDALWDEAKFLEQMD